jgi:seryl-tRNA synthetase
MATFEDYEVGEAALRFLRNVRKDLRTNVQLYREHLARGATVEDVARLAEADAQQNLITIAAVQALDDSPEDQRRLTTGLACFGIDADTLRAEIAELRTVATAQVDAPKDRAEDIAAMAAAIESAVPAPRVPTRQGGR